VQAGKEALHEETEAEATTEKIMKSSAANQEVSHHRMTFTQFWSVIYHKI